MVWLLNSQGINNCKSAESFCLDILFTQIIGLLKFWHIYCCHVYLFSVRYLNMCKPRAIFFSFEGLAHLHWHFMEVGQHVYQAGWEWMQAGSVPCNQNFFCKWNLTFFKAVPPNWVLFYLGNPLHIISSSLSKFFLFHNAILHKILKLGFWHFKPAFSHNAQ